jgi:hypothetical protein
MIERIEDMPAGTIGLAWFGHHSAWRRFALVTDVEWVARAMHMFAWMTPGEVLIRTPNELEEARGWVAG